MVRYTKALDSIKALRKDRVAELKAEKERLESLSREKSHADKLRNRITDLSAEIATKEIEFEDTKKQYDAIVLANAQFYDHSTKFREMFVKIENLMEQKKRYEKELEEGRVNVPEIKGTLWVLLFASCSITYFFVGTEKELTDELNNFNKYIDDQKVKRKAEQSSREDTEDDLSRARKVHVDLIGQHAELQSEAKVSQVWLLRCHICNSFLNRTKSSAYLIVRRWFVKSAISIISWDMIMRRSNARK